VRPVFLRVNGYEKFITFGIRSDNGHGIAVVIAGLTALIPQIIDLRARVGDKCQNRGSSISRYSRAYRLIGQITRIIMSKVGRMSDVNHAGG